MRSRENRLKRAIDVVGAGAVLVVPFPVQAIVGSAIRCSMGSLVLFRQPRPGKDELIFEPVKFRTMRLPDARDRSDAERLTRLGQFLRSTSLDELPTLWNVVRGDMSLVGPRPLLVEYLPLYSPEQERRVDVRPGVTGLAQMLGRKSIPREAKFAYDTYYVDRGNIRLDLKILKWTLRRVLRRSGITKDGHATTKAWQGRQTISARHGCLEFGTD